MTAAEMLKAVEQAELLSAEQLAELSSLPEAQSEDIRPLAKAIFQRGWLTRFQLNQTGSGRAKDLRVGPYVLEERLGEGGMGLVFRARHTHMERVVALKLMRKEKLSSPDAVRRFYQEVQAAARLQHPHIVLAYDAGQANNVHFFAMELVAGHDLARIVRERGVLTVPLACEYARQAALGLQHAAEKGLVHRDVKPANLLLAPDPDNPASPGTVKILDMGLARIADPSFEKNRELTRAGQVMGTPDYLAPEQAIDARNADSRADIYSLGCSLFFLLTGRAPFQAASLTELLLKHQTEQPAPLRSLRKDVPAALETLLQRLMAKSPADRPQTPAEVAELLAPFARGEKGALPPPPPPPPPRPMQAAATENTWAGLEDEGSIIMRSPLQPRERTRDRAETQTHDEEHDEPRLSRREQESGSNHLPLILAGVAAGLLLLIGGIVAAVALSGSSGGAGSTEPTAENRTNPRDKGKEQSGEKKPEKPVVKELPAVVEEQPNCTVMRGHKACVTALAVSADGAIALSGDESGQVVVWDLANRKLVRTLDGVKAKVTCLGLTPDGKRALIAAGGLVRERDLATGATVGSETRRGSYFSPDLRVALDPVSQPGVQGMRVLDLQTSGPISTLANVSNISQVGIAPDRSRGVLLSDDGNLVMALLDSGLVVSGLTSKNPANIATTVTWGRNNLELIMGDNHGIATLFILNEEPGPGKASTGRRTSLRAGKADGALRTLTLSSDRQRLLTGGDDRVVRLLQLPTGEATALFAGHNATVSALAVLADNRRFLSGSGDGEVRLWELDRPTSRPIQGPPPTQPPVGTELPGTLWAVPNFDGSGGFVGMREGDTIGVAKTNTTFRQFDLATGNERPDSVDVGVQATLVALSSDGDCLVLGDMRGQLQFVNMRTKAVISKLERIELPLRAVALSGDGKRAGVLIAGVQRTPDGKSQLMDENGKIKIVPGEVRVYDVATGKMEYQIPIGKGSANAVTFSKDDQKILVLLSDSLRVFEAEKGKELPGCHGVAGFGQRMLPLPEGRCIAHTSHNKYLIWDVNAAKVVRELAADGLSVAVACDAHGKRFLAVSSHLPVGVTSGRLTRHLMRLWDLETGKELGRVELAQPISSVAMSRDGKRLLAQSSQKMCYLDLATTFKLSEDPRLKPKDDKPKDKPETPRKDLQFVGLEGVVTTMAVSPDGKSLLAGGENGVARLWDINTGEQRWEAKLLRKEELKRVGFRLSGQDIFMIGTTPTLELRNVRNGEYISGMGGFGADGEVVTADYSVSGKTYGIAQTLAFHGRAEVPGKATIRGINLPGRYTAVLSLGDNTHFALGDEKGKVSVMDLADKRTLLNWLQEKQPILCLAHHVKTSRLAAGGQGKSVAVRWMKTGTTLFTNRTSHEGAVTGVAFSPDGKQLATASKDKTVRVWEIATGKEIRKFEDEAAVLGVVFHPDGKRLISCGNGLRVWELQSKTKE